MEKWYNQSVGDIWYDENIVSKKLTKNSFKVCGLSNNVDGVEDNLIKVLDILENKTEDVLKMRNILGMMLMIRKIFS